ncbi:IS4 family transposase [Enterococcus ureilyticus]|uniref:IS4 family transposase n=1 Tax=Enterococcus ureilyticus TaxID=1131292 RepID=UPI001F0B82C6|nr:IS4 family transposase [Enterococcus ureilyticus]
MQLEYNLSTGEFLNVHVGPGKNNDRQFLPYSRNSILPNDLCIRDLGYFKLTDLAFWHEQQAYFLTRIKANTTIFTLNLTVKNPSEQFSQVDLHAYLDTLSYGESAEIPEVYLGKKCLSPCRLVLYRLTPEQLEVRRKKQVKVSTSLKFDYSEKTIALSEFNLFITNVPCNKLPLHDISKLYSLRWQMELIFKTWKSYFNIHRTKTSKPQRFNCQLYG